MTKNEKTKKRPWFLITLLIWQAAALAYSYGASVLNPFEEKPLPTAEVEEKLRSLFDPTAEEIEEAWETIEEIRRAHKDAMAYWREILSNPEERERDDRCSEVDIDRFEPFYYREKEKDRQGLYHKPHTIIAAWYGFYDPALLPKMREEYLSQSYRIDRWRRDATLAEVLTWIDGNDYSSAAEALKNCDLIDGPTASHAIAMMESLACGGENLIAKGEMIKSLFQLAEDPENGESFEVAHLDHLWDWFDQLKSIEDKVNLLLKVSQVYNSTRMAPKAYKLSNRLQIAAVRLGSEVTLPDNEQAKAIIALGQKEKEKERFDLAAEIFNGVTIRFPGVNLPETDSAILGDLHKKSENKLQAFRYYRKQLITTHFFIEQDAIDWLRGRASYGLSTLYREQGNYLSAYYWRFKVAVFNKPSWFGCGIGARAYFDREKKELIELALLAGPFFFIGNLMYLGVVHPPFGGAFLALSLAGWYLSRRIRRRYFPARV